MHERVPRIAREVVQRNPDYPPAVRDGIERLAASIESNARLPTVSAPGPDVEDWLADCREHAGETWLDTEWFFAELLFYRVLRHVCRFWETGRDPFTPAKEEELAGDALWQRLDAALGAFGPPAARLEALLSASLWGNRVDLSYAVAAHHGGEQLDDDLLADDRPVIAARLLASRDVHLVADNTGTELALDLALVDALLDGTRRVTVHVKVEPVFVSDAMAADVWRLASAMSGRGRDAAALAGRLRRAFDEGSFRLAPDPFWTSPRFLWRAPPHLRSTFAAADIVVFKGDANYRRVVGDGLWPEGRTFAEGCDGLGFPLACLRTLKSDSVVGLPRGTSARLDAVDPKWRINGRRGVIQASLR